MPANVLYNQWGTYVEWYTDDDNGSGYGDNPKVAYWYGSRPDCLEMAKKPKPDDIEWQPLPEWNPPAADAPHLDNF